MQLRTDNKLSWGEARKPSSGRTASVISSNVIFIWPSREQCHRNNVRTTAVAVGRSYWETRSRAASLFTWSMAC